MSQKVMVGVAALAGAALVALAGSLYTVHQSQQALILQFGEPIRVVKEPGLHLKLPLLQQAEYFERRVLDFDAPSVELVLGDQKRLVVDVFARYRIDDPLRFRQASGGEAAFRTRLEPIIFSALRSVLGEVSLFQILSDDRTQLMGRIRQEANRALARFGIDIVDVRIKRADLPPENSQAIFRRMQTEREREAKELRAQGAEIAQRIRARADRERRVLIAEADKQASITRGEGDAEAVRIFGEAYGQDPEFFGFFRSMQAYRDALGDESTSLVISPDSEFFRYFSDPRGGGGREKGSWADVATPDGGGPRAAPATPAGPASDAGASTDRAQ
ncbi:protease modulator HflC [Marinimicrococcus flavescens]|uniref:Protein HflC n=1 Tax=Marinimicrococcus flavescens TaxID=3031815 RepID=A0AAP3XS21_9PROT|nr:protease modulator HflC [Marinimicrococcus flavescens]